MFRKLYGILLAIVLFLVPFGVLAAGDGEVIDSAGLFSNTEARQIRDKARQLAEKYDTNVLVVTGYFNGYSNNYARDYIEQYGAQTFPEGYIAYMINMADRSYWVDAYGDEVRQIFTQDKTDRLSEIAYDELSQGAYGGSALQVLKEIGNQYELASPMGWLKKPFLYPGKTALFGGISALIAGGLALVMTSSKQAMHRDKGVARTAAAYAGNFVPTGQNDFFIRHYQTRAPKPRPQRTSGGGGGFSGGGGSIGHTGSGGHF